MNPTISVAVHALADLSRFLLQSLDRIERRGLKSADYQDYFTHLQITAEKLLAEKLDKAGKLSQITWQLDLISQKSFFLHNYPSCFSSLILYKQKKVYGCVIYNLLTQDVYHAVSGFGARNNTRRIRVSKQYYTESYRTEKYILALDHAAVSYYQVQPFKQWLVTGSSMQDIVNLASGFIDGVITLSLNATQFQVAQLLLQEAGALTESIPANIKSHAQNTINQHIETEQEKKIVPLISANQYVLTHLKQDLCLI